MATLVFQLDEETSMAHTLEPGTTTVGRHPDSLIVLDCPSVSGHHALIEFSEDGCLVSDQQSSNGTRINGVVVEEAKLSDGDRVAFGDIQAVYYENEPPAEGEEVVAAAIPALVTPPAPSIQVEKETVTPAVADYRKTAAPRPARGRALRPVSGYPDQSEGGCVTALIVIALFVIAAYIGLHLRHHKETEGGNFLSDVLSKVTSKVPKIKIEK